MKMLEQQEFLKDHRYTPPLSDYVCLGQHDEFDMYLVYRHPFKPTLVARYGDDLQEFYTYNPNTENEPMESIVSSWIHVALTRLETIGVDYSITPITDAIATNV